MEREREREREREHAVQLTRHKESENRIRQTTRLTESQLLDSTSAFLCLLQLSNWCICHFFLCICYIYMQYIIHRFFVMVSLLINDTFIYKEYLNQSLFTVISSLLRKHSNIIYNGSAFKISRCNHHEFSSATDAEMTSTLIHLPPIIDRFNTL